MLDGFKGDKYLGRGGCLASLQTVGIRLETSRVIVGDITTGREPASLGRVSFISSLKVIKQMKAQGL